jgi:hypothetical protein
VKQKSLVLAAVVALAGTSAFAHHSFAMFDQHKVELVRGTLYKFTYLNPHSWISIIGTVDAQGAAERWDIEATSPSTLAQIGIRADTLKPGDKLTVAFHPLRDGRHGGSLVFVVTPDGAVHGAKPEAFGFDVAKLKPR